MRGVVCCVTGLAIAFAWGCRIGYDATTGGDDPDANPALATDATNPDSNMTTAPRAISDPAVSDALAVSLAWLGTGYGAAWTEVAEDVDRVAYRLLDGRGAGAAAAVVLGQPGTTAAFPAVAAAGDGAAVAWEDARDSGTNIYLALLAVDGVPRSAEIAQTATSVLSLNPAILALGDEIAVAWDEGGGQQNAEVWTHRSDAEAQPTGGDIQVSQNAGLSVDPALAHGGDRLAVVWEDHRGGEAAVYLSLFDLQGAATVSEQLVGPGRYPDVAWAGDGFLLAYEADRGADSIIVATSVTVDGTLGATAEVSAPDGDGFVPALASFATGVVAVWTDDRDGALRIAARTLDAAGQPTAAIVDVSAQIVPADWADVACATDSCLAAWEHGSGGAREIYTRQLIP